jgi:signal transduction histidine kinase
MTRLKDPIEFVVRHTPPAVLDTLIVLVAIYTELWNARYAAQELGRTWPWWVYVFPFATAIPLFWRRRHPFPVFVAVGGVSLAYTFSAHPAATYSPYAGAPIGLLVAIATVAYLGNRWQMRVAAVSVIVGTFVAVHTSESALLNAITYSFAFAVGRLGHMQRQYVQLFTTQMKTMQESASAREAEVAAGERARIARDLHDVLAHSVSVMVVQAEAGPVVVRSAPEKAEQSFAAIADAGRDALIQLRRMLGVLREDDALALAPQPTIAALPKLIDTVRTTGLDVRLITEGSWRQLPIDLEVAVYRTVQEALTNTVKHARARHSEVRLNWQDEQLTVQVLDDGIGSAPDGRQRPAPTGSGRGLIGIRERISSCGGEVSTGSGLSGGTGGGYSLIALIPFAG